MTDAWAVISPEGNLAWYPLEQTALVERLVGGSVAPGAIGGAHVAGPVRLLASDVASLFPADYAANLIAQRMISALSGGRIIQPFRGYVAVVQFERDEDTGELLWPGPVSSEWAAAINKAYAEASDG
jgi:hypothetical protein